MEPARITLEEIEELQKKGEEIVFVDARASGAWRNAATQIPGSIRVPPDEVDKHLGDIPRDRLIVTYCT
jgi:rhodanese-related sulfurtransferase